MSDTAKVSALSTPQKIHPPQIALHHWQEFIQDSPIAPSLAKLNHASLEGDNVYSLLCTALPDSERRNDGRLRDNWLNTYKYPSRGGWAGYSLDILSESLEISDFACFKPDEPRTSKDGKIIKYEHPAKLETQIFTVRVSLEIWQRIAQRYDLAMPEEIEITPDGEAKGFWFWVLNNPQLPLTVTEGIKKAESILTQGFIAIALPGVNNGYRTPKDDSGRKIGKSHLIPRLKKFCDPKRPITIAFDQDSKPKTVINVNKARHKLGILFATEGCQVKIASWDNRYKGADDLIVNLGGQALADALETAEPLEIWQAKQTGRLTYPVNLKLNQRYLKGFTPPQSAKVIGLKSPKNTGKTQFIADSLQPLLQEGQQVLLIGFRRQLVEEITHHIGIDSYYTVKDSDTKGIFGYGLCIDSLHQKSQIRFNPDDWADAIVIIDESEQVFWHALNASTEVQKHRVAILRNLRQLFQNLMAGNGQIWLSDADLSDISLDYTLSLIGYPVEPWIVVNEWQFEERWNVFCYGGRTPKLMFQDLVQDIKAGGKPFICTAGQSKNSKWGTQNLERQLGKKFPDKRILRIDSESISDPNHEAYGCIVHLNQMLRNYDIVIASPSIETGVSIDLKGHFTGVWALASGVQTTNGVRQFMSRLRDIIDRYFWAPEKLSPQFKIGTGTVSFKTLIVEQHKETKTNIRLLAESQINPEEIDINPSPESVKTWAKIAAKINLEARNYREVILAGLAAEGHHLMRVNENNCETKVLEAAQNLEAELKATKEAACEQHYQEVAATENPDESTYKELKEKRAKTTQERLMVQKGFLSRRYGADNVTTELVKLDLQGWYKQCQLHYYLLPGRAYLPQHDSKILQEMLEVGNGGLFQPDFNRKMLSTKVRALELLGIPNLFKGQTEFRNSDALIEEIGGKCRQFAPQLKSLFGITIADDASNIKAIQSVLNKMYMKMPYLKHAGSDGQRERIYGAPVCKERLLSSSSEIALNREQIFQYWLNRDQASLGQAVGSLPLGTEIEQVTNVTYTKNIISNTQSNSTYANLEKPESDNLIQEKEITEMLSQLENTPQGSGRFREIFNQITDYIQRLRGSQELLRSIWKSMSGSLRQWISQNAPISYGLLAGD